MKNTISTTILLITFLTGIIFSCQNYQDQSFISNNFNTTIRNRDLETYFSGSSRIELSYSNNTITAYRTPIIDAIYPEGLYNSTELEVVDGELQMGQGTYWLIPFDLDNDQARPIGTAVKCQKGAECNICELFTDPTTNCNRCDCLDGNGPCDMVVQGGGAIIGGWLLVEADTITIIDP